MRSRLATAVLCALGYGGGAPTAAADSIDPNGSTSTSRQDAADGSLSITTDTVRDGVGFNSFRSFRLDSGRTVNLHHPDNAEHLVNLVHEDRIEIVDGTVNSLVNGQVGGHLVFADPHGMIVGADGAINAGRLTLTTPTSAFMDSVVDGGAFGNTAATDALVNGTLTADDIRSDGVIEINGEINTTGGVRIHGGRVHVGSTGRVEAGTKDAVTAISAAVNVSGIETGRAASVTDGAIEIVAETEESIADGRTGEPLADMTTPPGDDEFAVAVSGRVAVARSDEDAAAEETGVVITGTDVRIGAGAEIDALGEATLGADGAVADAGDYVGGWVAITADTRVDPDADIWNPVNALVRDANLDLAGDIEGFSVSADARYIDVGGSITAARRAYLDGGAFGLYAPKTADGVVSLSAISERYSMWGTVEVDAGIRVDGALAGHALDLEAFAAATSGAGPGTEDDHDVEAPAEEDLEGYRDELDAQMSDGLGTESFGVAYVADADATIEIADGADLNAHTGIDIASAAHRKVDTLEMFGSFFDGVAMARGELQGETRVHVADGATLSAVDDIRVNGISDNDLSLKSQVANLSPISVHALSYAHGVVNTTTTAEVDHGAWLGESGDRIGGLELGAVTVNNTSVTAKAYSLLGVGLSTGISIADVDTHTEARLNADVAATGDVHVTARSVTEGFSNFTDVGAGLTLNAYGQIGIEAALDYASDGAGRFEADRLASMQENTRAEGLLSLGSLGTGAALGMAGIGVAASAGVSDVENRVQAAIGASESAGDAPTPTIDAGGDVTVYAERLMREVRIAGGATVNQQLAPGTAAVAIGLAKTSIVNDVDAVIGSGAEVSANRVGMSAVSDVPLQVDYGNGDLQDLEPRGFIEKYFNICAGLCNNVTTSYLASSSSAGLGGISATGNVNIWTLENDATATVADNAEVTATASPADGWTTDVPGRLPDDPAPGNLALDPVTLNWRDEIDVRAYARVEELHLVGLFSVDTFLNALLGTGTNPNGASVNVVTHDNRASAVIGDGAQLTAGADGSHGDIGVRARTDEFLLAISPSSSVGTGGFSINATAGIGDITTRTSATVAASAQLTGRNVTVAADHRIGAWAITGALSSDTGISVGLSAAGMLLDADVTARVGDPETDAEGDDVAVAQPPDDAAYTVRAKDLTVRARSWGDVAGIAIQGSLPGVDPGHVSKGAGGTAVGGQLTKVGKAGKAMGKIPGLSMLSGLIANPSFKSASDGMTFAASVTGATGFSRVDVDTVATLRNASVGGLPGGDPADGVIDVRVVARRELDQLQVAGALGMSALSTFSGDFASVNAAGTVGLSINEGATDAIVEGARMDDVRDLDVLASRADDTMVAGLSGATSASAGFAVDIVASGSIYLDETSTRAALLDSHVAASEDVRVLAVDESRVVVGAGAGTFSKAAVSGGVGVTLGFAFSERTIAAELHGGTVTAGADLRVQAVRATRSTAVAAAAGFGQVNASASVAAIYSHDTVRAEVADATLDVGADLRVSTDMTWGDIDFRLVDAGFDGRDITIAPDASPADLFSLEETGLDPEAQDAVDDDSDDSSGYDRSIAGGVNIGSNAAAGLSGAVNGIDNEYTAHIRDTTITGAPASVSVRAANQSHASAVSLGVSVGGSAAGTGNVAANLVDSTATAGMDNVTLASSAGNQAAGTVKVRADDSADIKAVAISGAVSGTGSGGAAAVAVNRITSVRTAGIRGGEIDADDVTVDAVAEGLARANAIGLAAGSAFGGAGSSAINLLDDAVVATIDGGADVEARNSVVVAATARQQARAIAGAGAISGGGAAIGGTLPVNLLATRVESRVGASDDDRTRVFAHGHGSQSFRTGELEDGSELNAFDDATFTEGDGGEFSGLQNAQPDDMSAEEHTITGVGVSAISLQESTSVGASLAVGNLAGVSFAGTLGAVAGSTIADVRNADIDAGDAGTSASVAVRAASLAHTSDVALIGAGSGGVAAGGGMALSAVVRATEAVIEDATVTATGAVEVDAKTRIASNLLAINLAGGATAGLAAQAGLIVHAATTKAQVVATALTADAVAIDADADNEALITVGSVGFGGAGGVGIAGGVLMSEMETGAELQGDNGQAIDIADALSVTASTDSHLRNHILGIAGGGVVGVAGSVAYSEFSNDTQARVTGTGNERLALNSGDDRLSLLQVEADETIEVSTRAGSAGIGVAGIGAGGAAAVVVGGSSVGATVSNVDARAQVIDIGAERDLWVRTVGRSVAGGVGALAGGASLILLGDVGVGELKSDLDADDDGSLSLVADLGSAVDELDLADLGQEEEDGAGDDEAGGYEAAITDAVSASPSAGDDDARHDGALVTIDNARLDSDGVTDINATTRVGTRATAGGGAIGAAGAGVGVARTALASATVVDIDDSEIIADHGVNVSAEALDRDSQKALDIEVISGAAAAFIGFGGSFADGENVQTVAVDIDDSEVDAGFAQVAARNGQTASVKAYAGAESAASGVATTTSLVLGGETSVAISGGNWTVGGLDIDARNDLGWNHLASGTGIGLVAGLAGASAEAAFTTTSTVTLTDGLAVNVPRDRRSVGTGIDVHAANTLERFGDDPVAEGYAGGLLAGAFPFSETTLDVDADVTIGSGVEFDARGGDPDGPGGDIDIGATNDIALDDHILSVAGGAVAATKGEKAGIQVNGTVGQTLSIGADARLFAARDIDAYTRADLDLDIAADASANGVGAGAAVAGTVDLDIVHAVTVDRTAGLGAFRDISLDAGTRGDSDVALHTEAYTRGLVGVAAADAEVDLDYDTKLDVGAGGGASGGFIRAGQDVRLAAGAGRVDATESWDKYFSGAFVPIHRSGGSASVDENEDFTLAMPVEAGYLNDIQIDILPDGEETDDGYRFTVTDSEANSIRDELLAWTDIELGEFNPQEAVNRRIADDADTDTSAILGRLSNAMPDKDVDTVRIGDLVVSAGDIVIDAGTYNGGAFSDVTLEQGASLTASGGPHIGINNASSRFLRVLGDLRLRQGRGGSIDVAGRAIDDANDLPGNVPDNVRVKRHSPDVDPEAMRIDVSNSLSPNALPGDIPAPGLFVEGDIANASGTVRLHNATGDLVQYGSTIARRIDIDVDNGTYTAHNPNGYWPSNHAAEFAEFYRKQLNLSNRNSSDIKALIKKIYPNIVKSIKGGKNLNFKRINEGHDDFEYYPADQAIGGADSPREIAAGSRLRAEWVGIDAKYIDIDTDIEVGRSSALSVDLGPGVLAAILQDLQDNAGASGYLELDAAAVEAGEDVIGARYNRDTGRIELERVTGSGPGGVYLNGHIYSSVYDADITVHRGAADIDIDNTTGIPLELAGIDAGTPGSAVVKITDHFKTNNQDQALTTWFVDGTRFEQDLAQRETRKYETYNTYAHWSDAVDALRSAPGNSSPLTRVTDGSTAVYSPKSGVGFRVIDYWKAQGNGKKSGDNGRTPDLELPDPIVDWGSQKWLKKFELKSSKKTVGDYSGMLDGDGNSNGEGDNQYERLYQTQIKGNVTTSSKIRGSAGGVKYEWSYSGEIKWAKFWELTFIRADADIGIGFTGGAGGIDIDSNAGVHVAGNLDNPSGATTIRAVADDTSRPAGWADEAVGIFSAAHAAQIDGRSLALEGTDNIGVEGEAGAVRLGGNGAIDAVSHAGSVYLAGPAQGEDALRIERVQADQGRAVIRHAGALVNAGAGTDAVVRAGAIDLGAERIGSNIDRLRIALTDADLTDGHTHIANAVNAEGATGVHLEAVSGDLLVGHIVTTASADGSGTGDISLVATGDGASIRAADDRETDFDAVVADGEAGWDALGLRNVEAAQARDVATFEAKVESGYPIYWQIRNLARDAAGEIIIDAEAERFFGPYADAAGTDIRTWIATEDARLEALFDEAFPDGRPAELQPYDPDATFTYDATAHEVTTTIDGETVTETVAQRVQVNRQAWSNDELAAPLPGEASQAVVGNVLDNTPVHIAATGDVTLRADGDLGRVLSDTEFTINGDWSLPDDEARAAVLGAGAGDIACEVADTGGACAVDDPTGIFLFGDEQTEYSFTVQRRQALRVDAQGALNAETDANALLGDGDADDGLTVGRIEAAGELRLLSTAGIDQVAGGRLIDAAGGLWMTSATGAIGSAADPISIAADGAVQDAVGSDGVYLAGDLESGHGGTLRLLRVAATGDARTIGLTSDHVGYGIEGVASARANLDADTLAIDYTGTLGSDAAPAPTLSDGMTITGHLEGSGWLRGLDSLATGNLTVTDNLRIDAPDGLDINGVLDVGAHADLRSPHADIALVEGSLSADQLDLRARNFTQAADTEMTVVDAADLDLTGLLATAGTLTAKSLDADGVTLAQADTGDIDVTETALFDFAGDIDLAGTVDADTLTGTSGGFNQATGGVITTATRAAITTTNGDLLVADVRSAGTAADAIDLDSNGAIGTNGSARPQLASANGGVDLDATGDIAAPGARLTVQVGTLSANTDAGGAWIELVGDGEIADFDAGGVVDITGAGALTYGRIRSHSSTLKLSGFSDVLGDGRLRNDGGTASLLQSGDALTVTSDGRIDKAAGFGGVMRIDSASAVELAAADRLTLDRLTAGASADLAGKVVELGEALIDADLAVVGTESTTLGDITTTDGSQTYTDTKDAAEVGTGTITWTDLDAGGAIIVDIGDDVEGERLNGHGTLRVSGAAVDLDNATTTGAQTLTATGALTVTEQLETQGHLTASGDSVEFETVRAATADVAATNDLTVTDLTARASATLAGAAVELTEVLIDGDLTTAGTASTVLGDITTGGSQTHTDGGAGEGTLNWTALDAGGAISVDVGGDVEGERLNGDDTVEVNGAAVDLGSVTADGIVAEADTIDAVEMEAASDIALTAVTDVTVFDLAAGGDLGLEAGGRWIFATLRTGGDVAARAAGIDGDTVSAGGTAFFRAGYADAARTRAAGGGATASGGLALKGVEADRARLHTDGTLEVADPHLTDGLEVRADTLSMTAIDTDGGGFDVDTAGATGGRMKTLDLTITGADRVTFDRLYTDSGHLVTESDRIDFDRARITGEFDIATPAIDLLVKNDEAIMQDGYDTQVYAPWTQFWLRQDGVMTRTSALILSAPRGWGMETARTLTGSELTELHEVFDGISSLVDPAAWSNGHRGNDPHPDGRPALKMTFECTMPFSFGNVGGFPGLWSANDRDCGAIASSRDPGRPI